MYLDLEARADRDKLADPRLFLREYEDRLVILDEIHRVPELFQELRGLIDVGRRRGRLTGRFLVLASASLDLLKLSGESLAGRIEYVALNTLDVLETAGTEVAVTMLMGAGRRGLTTNLRKGFHHTREDLKPARSFVVYVGVDRYPISEDIEPIGITDIAALLAGEP